MKETMKHPNKSPKKLLFAVLASASALLFTPSAAKANVYATDIQLNTNLTGPVHVSGGTSFTLTYHLNDNATAGVTINILSGTTVVSTTNIASPNAGTLTGLNTVSLNAPGGNGTYSVSIIAASTGYTNWQQINPLTTNYVAVFPLGMAVDKNTNSPYYGRVVVSCGIAATANGVSQQCGLYKFNADGTPADEGSFGYANFTTNDAGLVGTNQMAPTTMPGFGQWRNPSVVRIGEDDRIYWQDNSDGGAIIACDMLATTNQVILCSQNCPTVDFPNALVGPNYANCPGNSYVNQTTYGWIQFDIINTGTASSYTGTNGVYTGGQAAIFLSDWDYPCAGIWMWHLVGSPGSMTVDPTDTYGQQAVAVGTGSDALSLRSDGVAVDYNLDLIVGEARNNAGDPAARSAFWTNWNGGSLPPGNQGGAQGGGYVYAETAGAFWAQGGGSSSDSDRNVFDVVMNSKSNPTLLARAHDTGSANTSIDLLIPFNPTLHITGINLSGTNVTISCASSSPYSPVATQMSLNASATLPGTFTPVTNAVFTGGNGSFQVTTPLNGPMNFFRVVCPQTAGTSAIGSVTTIKGGGNEADTMSSIDTGVVYSGVAFDNVGNLYGANASDNYWRVWSPPGPNTNSTVAVATLSVP
jgi:hypothetical protein